MVSRDAQPTRAMAAAAACVAALASCSLLVDLDRFDRGSGARAATDAGATSPDGASDAAPGARDASSSTGDGDGADATTPCHGETEPNDDPTTASIVVKGRNCGVIGATGDAIDYWAFDQVGAGTLIVSSPSTDVSIAVALAGGGGSKTYDGPIDASIAVTTGHWSISAFGDGAAAASYELELQ